MVLLDCRSEGTGAALGSNFRHGRTVPQAARDGTGKRRDETAEFSADTGKPRAGSRGTGRRQQRRKQPAVKAERATSATALRMSSRAASRARSGNGRSQRPGWRTGMGTASIDAVRRNWTRETGFAIIRGFGELAQLVRAEES